MKLYVKTFLTASIFIPLFLYALAPDRMPFWPDGVSTGLASGAVAVVLVWKTRTDREMNRRLWRVLKTTVRR